MTPAALETLRTYAIRMGKSQSTVLREFRAESKTKQGELLTEMRRVEGEFLKHLALKEAEAERRGRHWTRRLGRWLGGWLAKARGR